MNPYGNPITTLNEWNAQLAGGCGCCEMPECPTPSVKIKLLSGIISPAGFFDPDDEEWILYKRQGERKTLDESWTSDGVGPSGSTIVTDSYTASGTAFFGNGYTEFFAGQVGSLEEPCTEWISEYGVVCEASGGSTYSVFSEKVWGDFPDYNYDYGKDIETVREIVSMAGQETQEHQDWVSQWTDQPTWQAAYDQWLIDIADWNQALADSNAEWDAYNEDYDEWVNGGMVGPEPEQPDEFTTPEPIEPDAEPEENYGPCVYKITHTVTVFDHEFGINSDGTSAAPDPDNAAVQAWIDAGMVTGPPAPGTGSYDSLYFNPFTALEALAITGTITSTTGFEDSIAFQPWIDQAKTMLSGALSFPSGCEYFSENTDINNESIVFHQDEPESDDDDVYISMINARQCFKVNPSHRGNWFEFVFDVIEEPDGWDDTIDDPAVTPPDPLPPGWAHPQIPDPAAPERSFVAEDVILEWNQDVSAIPTINDPGITPPVPLPPGWTHPQIPDPESDLWLTNYHTLDLPSERGVRRIVNVRYRCYHGPFGSLPQLLGEQVVLD